MKKFIIILFFSPSILYANECLNVKNALKENALWDVPTDNYIGYGFFPEYQYDEIKEDFFYDLDEKGLKINKIYPESPSYDVGLLGMYDGTTTNLVNQDIRLTHINDKEIINLSNEEIDNLTSVDTAGKKIKLTTLNVETDVSLKKTLRSSEIFSQPDVVVHFWIDDMMDVNPKRMEFTVKYSLSYNWTDNRWFDIVKEAGLGDDDKASSCPFTYEEVDKTEYQFWQPHLDFSNKVSVVDTAYNKPIRDELHISLNYDDEVVFERIISEVAVFNAALYFDDFPFDKHEVYFELLSSNTSFYFLTPHENTQNMADYFLNNILVPEWDQKDIDYYVDNEYEFYEDGSHYNSFVYSLTIQRDYLHYIYKLIIPIFIIMAICWSVFWIRGTQIETRLTVTVVSFLTLIAYNFVIGDDIPKIGTFTIFDKIILLAYIYAAVGTFFSIYSYSVCHNQNLEFSKLDYFARYLGPASYLVVFSIVVLDLYKTYIAAATFLGFLN